MSWLFGILAAALFLDAVRMRGRLGGLARLSDESADPASVELVTAPGAGVPDQVRGHAAAHCRANQLQALDLVPRDLPVQRALALASLVDPRQFRTQLLAQGRTAGHALALDPELCRRAGITPGETADPVAFIRVAIKAKAYAPASTDLAVARGLRAAREDGGKRLAVTEEVIGGVTPYVLAVQLIIFALLVLGVALPGARLWGLVALGVFHLQPIVATLGTPLLPRDLVPVTLLRLPWELLTWLRTVTGRWRADAVDPVDERRPAYRELLAGDPARFFEPRRESCPVCESKALSVHLRVGDLLQHKPGRFTLECCDECGHIFQNPRLSLEGLSFYYRDFYDGLGEKGMEFIFGYSSESYIDRANMVKQHAIPSSWLDVGTGHGHFCCVAKELLPNTRFDGLDLSESVEEAERRGWIATGHRGLFPDRARDIAGSYDVVSMHHYLEHTLDPASELAAAHTALSDGGHLLIEVPDPDCRLGRWLGRFWLPWFQPQHQHLLSVANLERLLEKNGFHTVEWHRGEAHQQVDFLFALYLILDRIAPPTNVPWREPPGIARRAWRALVWTVGVPFMPLARLADQIASPAMRRARASNTYRVLAQKS